MASTAIRICSGLRPLLFVDGFDLACVVVTAVRADAMRRLGLLTLRAQPGGRGPQRVMGPALRGAGLGMSAFWIRHRKSLATSTLSAARAAGLPTATCTG